MSTRYCPHCLTELHDQEPHCPRCGRDVRMQNNFMQLAVGTVLRGRSGSYRFGKAIGSGGFGQTYLALDLANDGLVAIKEYYPKRCNLRREENGVVRPTQGMDQMYRDGMESFLREATMLAALSTGPNTVQSIVHVSDYFEALGTAYMVMDFVIGDTLRTIVEAHGRMEPIALLTSMSTLMHDIDIINNAGVVHRDIAPDNIILTPQGTLRLIDFGCARSMEDGRSMEVVLKPGFAPTEQYTRHGQGPYTDVYALCASIYYCLTAIVPAAATDRAIALSTGRPDPLASLSSLNVVLPPGVEPLLMRGLEIQAKNRIQTMDELASALDDLLSRQANNSRNTRGTTVVEEGSFDITSTAHEVKPNKKPHSEWFKQYGVTIVVIIAIIAGVIALVLARCSSRKVTETTVVTTQVVQDETSASQDQTDVLQEQVEVTQNKSSNDSPKKVTGNNGGNQTYTNGETYEKVLKFIR